MLQSSCITALHIHQVRGVVTLIFAKGLFWNSMVQCMYEVTPCQAVYKTAHTYFPAMRHLCLLVDQEQGIASMQPSMLSACSGFLQWLHKR